MNNAPKQTQSLRDALAHQREENAIAWLNRINQSPEARRIEFENVEFAVACLRHCLRKRG